jgi:hypothetical protein
MSWHISKALMEACENSPCLREPVAEYSVENCLDGELSALLKSNPTAGLFSPKDKMTEYSRLSQSGMIFAPLTESLGGAVLTLFLAAFPVRTSALQEKEKESPESALDYGVKCSEWFAKLDPDSCSWKIPQCSLFEDSEQSLETWPRWGMMLGGVCWEQTPPELYIIEPDFGWWPTPTASDWKATGRLEVLKRQGIPSEAGGQTRPQYHYARMFNRIMPVQAQENLNMWPLGWTDLKPLGTDKFPLVQDLHGKS